MSGMHQPSRFSEWASKVWFIIGLWVCLASGLNAQSIQLSGRVTDATTAQPLVGASVIVTGTDEGTATDTGGHYRLTIPLSAAYLRISHVGYVTAQAEIEPGRLRYDIALAPVTAPLDEITVRAEANQDRLQRAQMGLLRLPAQTLAAIPSLGGERDVLRAIQALPGIRANNDLSIGYHVRGGTTSQNLVLLDGIPVYNPWHLFGFFSAFNVDALETIHLMKGAFPAEYGGRLSSVLALDLKERTPETAEGRFTISTMSAQGVVYGTSLENRLRWMVAGRRSYLDPLLWLLNLRANSVDPDADVSLGYVMSDFNAKLVYEMTPTLQLSGSLFAGRDRLKGISRFPNETELAVDPLDEDRGHYGWRNLAGRVALHRTFSDRFVATLSAYVTCHSFGTGTGYANYRNETRSDSLDYSYGVRFRDWNVRLSNDWQ
ncbi:MAG TPA: TonB-dependent receptor, partial [Rhodothermales bacterium]|nr:TonB-dependent receptor [Rhodothermales bacterium]